MDSIEYIKIKDFSKGVTATGFFLVKDMNIKTSANNKKYGDYTIVDETGEINAKMWDVADEAACPRAGDVIKVQGLVTEWQGSLQFRMDKFRPYNEGDPVDITSIIPSAPYTPDQMMDTIKEYVSRIDNADIKNITVYALEDFAEKLRLHPAALKNHHSIRSGLLYHTTTMLRLADGMIDIYGFLNKSLLYAGVILHDLCKTTEIEAGDSGVAVDYSPKGMLLGHISQGVAYLEKVGAKLGTDEEILMMLQHMLLAHHYEPEYGSPRRPMFPEAEILHYLDMIDTRMFDMQKALDGTEPGAFTDKMWTLHNRKLYKKTFL